MQLLHATAVTLTAVHHMLHFIVYLMAGTSAAGLILVLYLLFQLEYDVPKRNLLELRKPISRETSDKS